MATRYTKPSISGYNTNPPSDDGQQVPSNEITWAKHKTKLADPIKTLVDAINTETESVFNEHAKVYNTEFLQTVSDIQNGQEISVLRFIDRAEHSAIRAGTSTTDVSSDFQDALDTNARLFIPAGTYIVGTELTAITDGGWSTGVIWRGEGQQVTIFDNRVASGAMLRIDQLSAGNAHFHYGNDLSHFTITTTTTPASSVGLECRGINTSQFKHIRFKNLTGDAFQFVSDFVDLDQSVWHLFDGCRFEDCLRGINVDPVSNATAIALYEIVRCQFWRTDKAGLRIVGGNADIRLNTFFECSGDEDEASLYIYKSSSENRHIDVRNNLFEKDKFGGIEIESLIHGLIENNSISPNSASNATFGIRAGKLSPGTGVCRYIEMRNNRHVVDATTAANPYVCYDLGDQAEHCDIISPRYAGINGATKVALTATAGDNNNHIEAENRRTLFQRGKELVQTTVTGAGTITLDLLDGNWQQVRVETSTQTINAPTDVSEGQEFRLTIVNASGGAITVTLGTGFSSVSTYADPPNGEFVTCNFAYNNIAGVWQQTGAWSDAT